MMGQVIRNSMCSLCTVVPRRLYSLLCMRPKPHEQVEGKTVNLLTFDVETFQISAEVYDLVTVSRGRV